MPPRAASNALRQYVFPSFILAAAIHSDYRFISGLVIVVIVPLFIFFLLTLGLFAQKPVVTPTIAATYSATLEPTEIVWSPEGKDFAWIEAGAVHWRRNGDQARLVRLAELAAKQATAVSEPFGWTNRGVHEQTLQWIGNRALVVKERGDLFELDGAGKSRAVTATNEEEFDPKVSPDGLRVAYRRGHDLYTQVLATGRVTRLTTDGTATRLNGELDWVYPEELGIESAYWWSPDSRSIAFLQFDTSGVMLYPQADLTGLRPVAEAERFPQAGTPNSKVRLGVVRAGGGGLRWLETGAGAEDLLARVDWMPDSQAVLVRRLTRTQQKLTLMKVPVAGGAARMVLEENDPAWVNLRDDFAVLGDGKQVLWGSERTGYRHLYVMDGAGKVQRQLTAGDWEVTSLECVNADWAYYTSTEASPLGRQLYRVRLDGAGAGKELLTPEPGSHAVSVAPGCGEWMDTFSSLREPPRKMLGSAGRAPVIFKDANIGALGYQMTEPEHLTFAGADGTRFYARLTKPAGFDGKRKYPVVVMVYGGPHAQRVRDQWRGADLDQALAAKGFVVWEMDNRGTAGRGHVFEKPLYHRFGKLELEDQLDGVRYLKSLGFVDEKRIGVHGWSYGGFMTLTAMLQAPDVFRAGVAGAPVTDWRNYDSIYTERYLGLPSENEEGYRASSPVHAAANLQGKLMIIHNFEDDNVLFQHTMRMMDALQKAAKQFEFQMYPQKAHHVSGAVRGQMLEALVDFFVRQLGSAN
jgi:dipeptidyl-peptidase 4